MEVSKYIKEVVDQKAMCDRLHGLKNIDDEFMLAVSNGLLTVVEFLWGMGAKSKNATEVLVQAAKNGHFDVFVFLCEICDYSPKGRGIPISEAAARSNSVNIIEYLHTHMQYAFSFTERSNALFLAVYFGSTDVVKYIIKNGYLVTDGELYDSFIVAAENNRVDTLKYFKNTYASYYKTIKDQMDKTALQKAIYNEATDAVDYLLQCGVSSDNFKDAMIVAVLKNNMNCLDILLKYGTVDYISKLTIDSIIFDDKYTDMVKYLHKHGCKVLESMANKVDEMQSKLNDLV